MTSEFVKMIEDLEREIQDTDKLIQEGFIFAEYMVEPIKSDFKKELKSRQALLDINKVILETFKSMRV